jgi:nicotinamide-nucleotide amidase
MMTTRGLSLALAESCTGGLIAHRITRVPGSSRYFKAGYVSYSNEAKTDLFGVEPALIKSKGAVSPEVALKMAEGALKRSGASIALSATGIAGPDGGTPEKPVGLVWMGLCDESGSQAVEYRFFGHRDNIQFRASQAALELLRRHVLGMALKG